MEPTYDAVTASLRASYDGKADERESMSPQAWKQTERQEFLALLQAEHRRTLLELGSDLKSLPANASDDQLRQTYANVAKPLLDLSKCPDFVVNRGHYFGTVQFNQQAGLTADEQAFGQEPVLSDSDKRALIDFLKMF